MNINRFVVGALCALSLAACSEPVATIPGGQLSGEANDAPVEWAAVPGTIQLETRPTNPYSINIWSVGIGPDLYVATGAKGTKWSGFIEEDRSVMARLGRRLYPLHAVQVDDPTERARVAAAYTDKYDIDEVDGWVVKGVIFRLDRR